MLYLWSELMLFLGMLDLGIELVAEVSGDTSCATLSLVTSWLDTLADLAGAFSILIKRVNSWFQWWDLSSEMIDCEATQAVVIEAEDQ